MLLVNINCIVESLVTGCILQHVAEGPEELQLYLFKKVITILYFMLKPSINKRFQNHLNTNMMSITEEGSSRIWRLVMDDGNTITEATLRFPGILIKKNLPPIRGTRTM